MSKRIIPSRPPLRGPLLATLRRTLLAMVGGYAWTTACAIGIAWLPLSRADAVIAGMVSSFAIYTAFVIWAFTGRAMFDAQGQWVAKAHFRQSMSWLHTWSGLLASWLLFSIFVTGSAAYYRAPITEWMQPERLLAQQAAASHDRDTVIQHRQNGKVSTQDKRPTEPTAASWQTTRMGPDVLLSAQQSVTQSAIHRLREVAPDAERWMITLPDGSGNAPQIKWDGGARRKMQVETLDTTTEEWVPSDNRGATTPRATEGGNFFYTFHYALHYLPPIVGECIVGIAAMFMLVAIVSGIVTHRRIFVDFFTFRPRKGLRSWMDGHIISAVLVLPYHLMITYSGLVLLMAVLMPWPVQARYPGADGRLQFYADAYDYRPAGKSSGQAAPLTAIVPLLQQAQQHFGRDEPKQVPAVITIEHPADLSATVRFELGEQHRLSVSQQTITFNGVTGERTAIYDTTPVRTATGVLMGLHQAFFAPPFIRALFFLSGLGGAVMVGSGLVMWAHRYRQKHQHRDAPFGVRLVEHLNIATIAGMPIAVASYFWANRLLSSSLTTRSGWEVRIFFIVWTLALLHPFWRKGYRAWRDQLGSGAALFILLPLLDWSMIGTWVMPGFDVVCAALGALLGAIACYTRRRAPVKSRSSKATPMAPNAGPNAGPKAGPKGATTDERTGDPAVSTPAAPQQGLVQR